jgi:acylphosphatase
VGYRAFVVREAQRAGLDGYARNLPDGRVEVVAWGDAGDIARLLARLAVGPAAARVDGVETADLEPPWPAMPGFDIRF